MSESRQAWLGTGLHILAEEGFGGLTIARMAAELGLTKGSFYHHFKNVRDFEQKLIAHWAGQFLSTADQLPPTAAARLQLLDRVIAEAFSPTTEPEVAIRFWAQQDPMVRAYLEQVDAARRKFLLEVFEMLVGDERQASLMADMLSAILIGSITIVPCIAPERVQALYAEFKRLWRLGA